MYIIKNNFEITFKDLIQVGSKYNSAKKTYELLKLLSYITSKPITDELVMELNKIKFASNVNSTFYFYFPIISHILYYKPEYASKILDYLIEPNFINGTDQVQEMIEVIQSAMKYKLSTNENFLTKEGQSWVTDELPKLEIEIEREIQRCRRELEE